jgi:polyisoprenoid-binding protein YceI
VTRFTLGAVLWFAAIRALAAPALYDLDSAHSFVHFEVQHFGASTLRGRLGPVVGTVELDRDAKRGEVGLRIETRSVDMGLGIFSARMREADLLAVDAFPEAFFVARRFRFDERGGLAEVRGEFTFRGVSQPLSLLARLFACREDPARGAEVCGGEFEAQVLRSEFGATFGLPLIGDRVRLRIQVEGVRRAAAPSR